ncbi:hypothetical protein FNH05_12800 [Amycolatopsis rhizosphaerae]|uniref:Uncharacterized protein n=1 Tax=Amycolatopsis rhizosphaerae TaxID=2053003 RepID=A0A558CUW9_9PSEU|nr:hypothetical protein [Amycolatopsis rhizosphaerae]TVT52546.1 hypothetical protein FNH05_12800 [Amycolatopsis rhizosphaerae]
MPVGTAEAILHILRIKSRATVDYLAGALDLPPSEIATALTALARQGLTADSGKPRFGWGITPPGKETAELRITATNGARELLDRHYATFRGLNDALKQLCADWQQRDQAHEGTARLAARFAARLAPIDDGVQAILAAIVPSAPAFGLYAPRLSRARAKFAAGDDRFLTGILVDSYHNVWFECHECFFLALGRSRQEEEAAR